MRFASDALKNNMCIFQTNKNMTFGDEQIESLGPLCGQVWQVGLSEIPTSIFFPIEPGHQRHILLIFFGFRDFESHNIFWPFRIHHPQEKKQI